MTGKLHRWPFTAVPLQHQRHRPAVLYSSTMVAPIQTALCTRRREGWHALDGSRVHATVRAHADTHVHVCGSTSAEAV